MGAYIYLVNLNWPSKAEKFTVFQLCFFMMSSSGLLCWRCGFRGSWEVL